MNIKSERDKRNYIIIALCLILVIMGVGYAAFNQLLTIDVTSSSDTNFCVGFDNTKTNTMNITKGLSTGTTPIGSMSYSGTACGTNLVPTSSLNARFYQPGDEIEYTLTIKNASTVSIVIESILVDDKSVTGDTTRRKGNITYIIEMPENTTLTPNASTTMKVTAKFQNDTDVTGSYSGETQSINVKINGIQDDGNGGIIVTEPKFTGTIYRYNSASAKVGDLIVPESGTKWCDIETLSGNQYDCYDTEIECNTFLQDNNYTETNTCQQKIITSAEKLGVYTTNPTTLNKTFYLKHDVEDNIITASYVCFVYNNAEFCMKGGDGGASFTANTQIVQTYQNLEDVTCSFNPSSFDCHFGLYYNVFANSDGEVGVYTKEEACYVYDDGLSDCGR